MEAELDEQKITAQEYDRWLQRDTILARWVRFWFSPRRTIWLNTQVRKLPAAARMTPADCILDIGCGYGGLLIHLRQAGASSAPLAGMDNSSLILAQARAELRQRSLTDAIRLTQGVATALPYAADTFDIVICAYVIKHLPDRLLRAMLAEVRRVLKPGGRFCVWEAAPSRYGFMNVWNMKLLRSGNSIVCLRSAGELRAFLEEAGFHIEQPFGHGLYYFYPPLPRAGFIASRPS